MIVNSNVLKGRCPICGAANCTCGKPSTSRPVDEMVVRASEGPLHEYEIRPGRYIKLTAEEAAQRGLTKMREQSTSRNKMQLPSGNKDR